VFVIFGSLGLIWMAAWQPLVGEIPPLYSLQPPVQQPQQGLPAGNGASSVAAALDSSSSNSALQLAAAADSSSSSNGGFSQLSTPIPGLLELPWKQFFTNKPFIGIMVAHSAFGGSFRCVGGGVGSALHVFACIVVLLLALSNHTTPDNTTPHPTTSHNHTKPPGAGHYVTLSWLPTFYHQAFDLDVTQSATLSVLPWLATAVVSSSSGVLADWLTNEGHLDLTRTRKLLQLVGGVAPAVCLLALADAHDAPNMGLGQALALLTGSVALGGFQSAGFASNRECGCGCVWLGGWV